MKTKYAGNKNVLICDSMPSIEFWSYSEIHRAIKLFTDTK